MSAATVFLALDVPSMVVINLAPRGDGARTVCVWTWPDGPDAVQSKPFEVPSLEAARDVVPAGAIKIANAPPWFADEAWYHPGKES